MGWGCGFSVLGGMGEGKESLEEEEQGASSPWSLYQNGLHLDWPVEDTVGPGTPSRPRGAPFPGYGGGGTHRGRGEKLSDPWELL